MNKNLCLILLGVFAVISGAVITLLLLKNKFKKDEDFDFDDFDDIIDDEEFEHFFGTDDDFEDEEQKNVQEADKKSAEDELL